MTTLLDTHFLVWLILQSPKLSQFPWLDQYRPWGVSPISLLEIQYLAEVGRLRVRNPAFTEQLQVDPRFIIDEVPLFALVRHALDLSWTRDPFDRLSTAHSMDRRIPLCTTDRVIQTHHAFVVQELRQTVGKM